MAPFLDIFPVPPLGCNCTIVGDTESKEAVVVDPGGDVQQIIKKLDSKGLKCKRILITHGHLDHVLGGRELKERTGADILMHQDDLGLYEKVEEQCRDFGVPGPPESLPKPDAYVSDGDVIQWAPDLTVRCLHCPGHTPGSTAYLFEQHKLCCPGDTLFRGSVGRTNWAGIPSLQGTSDSQQILGSIKSKLFSLDPDTRVVSGHGQETTIGAERSSNPHVRL
ncbi:hypothetical protein CYMTET_8371 [Cymbomonas tetramitiformis]|uniref:Metallo-beta-lactamase domain-containing protein n=1 Tax=Cymbomonas tetramitiformis TaxID=36881 RepID=A0AAE0LG23_9CHLO|nr:hypothetical protein CYMTET_8371 [Cymbomonas tetramitiformis]